jgi:uncharacterized protein YoxC
MSGGDIAGLAAAVIFAILVGLLALPLIKLGKVFDETSAAIRELSSNVTPLLEEATTTISESNKQLGRIDTITGDIAETTGNVTALVSLFAASVGGPLIKVAAFSAGVRAAIGGLDPRSSRRARRAEK